MTNQEVKPSPELEAAVWSTLYHDPRSTPVIISVLTGRVFETPPPVPTALQREMAREIVEELLSLHYQLLSQSVLEVTGELIEIPEFDFGIKAGCECVHHAEQGLLCPHQVSLQSQNK